MKTPRLINLEDFKSTEKGDFILHATEKQLKEITKSIPKIKFNPKLHKDLFRLEIVQMGSFGALLIPVCNPDCVPRRKNGKWYCQPVEPYSDGTEVPGGGPLPVVSCSLFINPVTKRPSCAGICRSGKCKLSQVTITDPRTRISRTFFTCVC